MTSFKIAIPSLIENITIIESFIDNAREKFDINDDIYGNIMISVTECVSNAIIHGNGKDIEKKVHIELHFSDDQLTFIVSDEGTGFNHDTLKDPTAPENLERTGGRGIYIMEHLADEVKYENNGSKAFLTFYMN
ncbi:ATP-binding protein [Nitritalea halalkaliphila LW7]|uniref:ATP-binding protein n=1 Tax=Nitritalea halalkaliphila LW7 TaxID=1189621 RepID=I5C5G9_9BACT|nr:ATP-binding protein [Nitritalea halalkaliphila]EIM77071.1 ATP-binding protein [Nitritalea halalkaliphila LW7]